VTVIDGPLVDGKVIDGKAFAAALRGRIATHAASFEAATGRKAGLAVVLVGEDPASSVYVRSKGKQTVEAGMAFEHRLPADTDEATLLALIGQLNADPAVDGILVQLPARISEQTVIAIDPDKDVDGFHTTNAGRLAVGQKGFVPCTPLGCLMLLKDRLGDLSGLDAVVIGRSNIVGKPMAQLLLGESCTVTIAHSRTKNLPEVVRRADIVVAAVGRPHGAGRLDQAGRHGHRRRHQPHRRARRQTRSGRRCGLCIGGSGGRRHHPRAGRRGADDHCGAAGQYAERGASGRRFAGTRPFLISHGRNAHAKACPRHPVPLRRADAGDHCMGERQKGPPGGGSVSALGGYALPSEIVASSIAWGHLVTNKGWWEAMRIAATPDAQVLTGAPPPAPRPMPRVAPSPPPCPTAARIMCG
jgi:methylenetetrahydrofolate dehydrogenase (NADP+)/methenyltetrahydrofolate cyclohydrolase